MGGDDLDAGGGGTVDGAGEDSCGRGICRRRGRWPRAGIMAAGVDNGSGRGRWLRGAGGVNGCRLGQWPRTGTIADVAGTVATQ